MNRSSHASQELKDNNLEQLNALLNRYCLSLTHSVWDSDDLVQDTWVKCFEMVKNQSHNNPEALLLRTAKNTWIDHVRRGKVFDRILNTVRELANEEGETIMENSSINMELAFYCLIKHLSPLQRTVMMMRSVLGYSVADTAIKLQTTEGAVKAAYHRARKELQDVVQNVEDDTVVVEDEACQFRLSALVRAYVNGDVDEVLRLIQLDGGEQESLYVVHAYSMVSRTSATSRRITHPSVYCYSTRMAA